MFWNKKKKAGGSQVNVSSVNVASEKGSVTTTVSQSSTGNCSPNISTSGSGTTTVVMNHSGSGDNIGGDVVIVNGVQVSPKPAEK